MVDLDRYHQKQTWPSGFENDLYMIQIEEAPFRSLWVLPMSYESHLTPASSDWAALNF